MRSPWLSLSIASTLGLGLGACSGDTSGDQVCTPGKTETCACPGGVDGAQACNADGTAFEDCVCPGGTTGGGTATGGTTTGGTATGGTTTGGTATGGTSTGGSTTMAGTGGGGEIWLQNDSFVSGTMAAFQQGFAQGECWGSVYVADPGQYPFSITGVEMLVGGDTAMESFELAIWEVDASNKPTVKLDSVEIGVTGSNEAFSQADFTTVMLSQPVIMSGNFALAMCLVAHSGAPAIARDADGISSADRNWLFTGGMWSQSQLFGLQGDWIMRARIEPQ